MHQAIGQSQEVSGVSLSRVVEFSLLGQPLQAELTDRLQHLVARFLVAAGALAQQALLHQRHDAIENG